MPLLILWTSSVPTRRGNTWRRREDGRGVTLGWHHSKNLINWINWNGNRSSFDKFTFHYSMNSWWYPTMIWITYTLSVKPSVLKFKPSTQPNSSIWSRTISIYGTWAPQIPGIITRAIRTFSLLFRPAIVIVCVWHLDLSLICVFSHIFFSVYCITVSLKCKNFATKKQSFLFVRPSVILCRLRQQSLPCRRTWGRSFS